MSKRDLQAEVDRPWQALDGMGVTEREQLAAEVSWLREEAGKLRREHAELTAAVVPLRAEVTALNAQRARWRRCRPRSSSCSSAVMRSPLR